MCELSISAPCIFKMAVFTIYGFHMGQVQYDRWCMARDSVDVVSLSQGIS